MMDRTRLMPGAIAVCWSLLIWGAACVANAAEVLARVNGEAITQEDLDFELLINGLKGNQPPHVKQRKLENLIEKELVLQHLTKKGIKPDPKLIDHRIATVKIIIKDAGLDPDKILPERGFTPDRLRKFFSSSAMWEQYLTSEIDGEQLKKYFESRKKQFDGTEVRVSQIYLKLPEEPAARDVAEAKRTLNEYKTQIDQGKITFADAAKKWSMAPSKAEGGDLSFTFYDGPLPSSLTAQAFQLEPGKLSEPFQTPFGMHLLTVTEIRPGQFELEDVRQTVRAKLYQEIWNKLVPDLKQKAEIEYVK